MSSIEEIKKGDFLGESHNKMDDFINCTIITTFDKIREMVGPDMIENINEQHIHQYGGYEKLEFKLKKLTEAFYHKDSQMLDIKQIKPFVQELLVDPVFMKYTLENIDNETMFHSVYDNIIVKKKVYFEKIREPFTQFALTWLFTRYH